MEQTMVWGRCVAQSVISWAPLAVDSAEHPQHMIFGAGISVSDLQGEGIGFSHRLDQVTPAAHAFCRLVVVDPRLFACWRM